MIALKSCEARLARILVRKALDEAAHEAGANRDLIGKAAKRKEIIATKQVFIAAWEKRRCTSLIALSKDSKLEQLTRFIGRVEADEAKRE